MIKAILAQYIILYINEIYKYKLRNVKVDMSSVNRNKIKFIVGLYVRLVSDRRYYKVFPVLQKRCNAFLEKNVF